MWDPTKYLAYADHRGRPFHELVARIGATAPRRVIDLGCGPGNLTVTLRERWPDAELEALDSSPEMVAAAAAAGLDAREQDLHDWTPAPDTDVVIANAVLQWVPDHVDLIQRWLGVLPSGSWLAFQVPGNFDAPSHVTIRELAAEPRWQERLGGLELRAPDAARDPRDYADLLADAGCHVDAWETSYLQRLEGPDPVLEWVTGTALRPIKSALAEPDWRRFHAELGTRLRTAYPARPDGVTWFDFRRIFVVARLP
jgi:trans-aconitate 2-methyltransferase